MKNTTKLLNRRLILGVSAAALACASLGSHAQTVNDWPQRPIKIIIAGVAGGVPDIMARAIGDVVTRNIGQSVVVEAKPGALGGIATDAFLAAPRDGYTFMMAVNSLVSEIPFTIKPKHDPFKDLVPLVEVVSSPLVLVANGTLPVSNLKDMAAYVKANPGKISFASYSPGTISHVLGLQLNKLDKLDMQHVGYKGAPPALQDVMGGQVQFMFDGLATSVPHIKGGKLKALAVTSTKRSPVLPDTPTVSEQEHPDLTAYAWIALWTTPGVPAAAQNKLRTEVIKAISEPAFKQKFAAFGLEVNPNPPTVEQMQQTLRKESQTVGDLLRSINYKPE